MIIIAVVNLAGCIGDGNIVSDINSTDGFDASRDYFPDKVNVEYAKGFTVEYHNNYKVVTVREPESEQAYTYLLVQKGTPVPEIGIDAMLIEVPVESVIALSTTQLPALDVVGEVGKLKAVGSFANVNTLSVREMIEEGSIEEVGSGSNTNTELIVSIRPDLILTTTTSLPEYDKHINDLVDAGLDPAIDIEYKECTPLGRAEWVKYISLFFNKEKEANDYFSNVSASYEELRSKVAAVETRPTVMGGDSWQGMWYVPGGNSFIAEYIKDAGAAYFYSEDGHTASVPLDYEAVFNIGKDTDYWITSGTWDDLDVLKKEDPIYSEFKAVENGNVYTSYSRLNDKGGNDYYESGVIRPDVVLADLVKIFHPELLPDHELVYYKKLVPASRGN